jgi:hypothetical protein
MSKLSVFNVGSGFLVWKHEPSVRTQPGASGDTGTCECDAEVVPILGVEAGPVYQVQSAADHIPSCEGRTIGLPCTTTVTFTTFCNGLIHDIQICDKTRNLWRATI